MRACIIFNPAARGDRARSFRKHLDEFSGNVALKPTVTAGHGRVLAAEAVNEGFDTIVAAGGDGTLNEVLNGIGDAPDGFARARLAVLPLGTVNVFAKELGLPMNLRQAWKTIRAGRETQIDLPRAEFAGADDSSGGSPNGTGGPPALPQKTQRRYFAQMAGAGLDARAIQMVDWELKKKLAQFAYVVAGMKAMKGPHPQITFRSGADVAAGELVLIGNGRFYGGKLPVFHSASLTDGRLDVCVFPRVNWFTVLRYGLGLLTGGAHPPANLRYFQTAALTLTAVPSAPFELEGDVAGQVPLTISVRPRALRVIVA